MSLSPNGFVFDGVSSEEFGLVIAFYDSKWEGGSAGSEMEFTKTSNPVRKRWIKIGQANYQNPLEFTFQVMKRQFVPFDSYELSAISRWLIRQDGYKRLQFVQEDYSDVYFNAYVKSTNYIGDGKILALEITFVCDAPFGYGEKIKGTWDVSSHTENFYFHDMSDEVGYIYPDMTITIHESCDFTIHNSIENRNFIIRSCVPNEVITINGNVLQMKTTSVTHNLYESSNFNFFRFSNTYNTRKNIITVTGKSTIQFSYIPIRKVGG